MKETSSDVLFPLYLVIYLNITYLTVTGVHLNIAYFSWESLFKLKAQLHGKLNTTVTRNTFFKWQKQHQELRHQISVSNMYLSCQACGSCT